MTQGVERLKELLFESESQTLSDLDRRVEDALSRLITLEEVRNADNIQLQEANQLIGQLLDKVGAYEKTDNVASFINDALQEAGEQNREGIAQSLAQLSVKTIESEPRKNLSKLADIFYPITGRMVKLYVANAAKRFADKLNRLLECNFLMLRIRSAISGKSVAELSIIESQHLQVEEIFLLQRQQEALLGYWSGNSSDISEPDTISVIYDFAINKLKANDCKLASFELGHTTVFVRVSSFYIVAARCSGIAPAGINTIINQEFLSLLEKINLRNGYATSFAKPTVYTHELTPFVASVNEKAAAIYAENARAGLAFRPLRGLLLMFVVAASSSLMWWGYVTIERKQVEKTAEGIIARITKLQGYPINLAAGHRGREIRINGLAPNAPVVSRLRSELANALPNTNVIVNLSILPGIENMTQKQLLSGLKSQIAAVETEAKRNALRKALQRTSERLVQTKSELKRIGPGLKSKLQRKALETIKESVERIEDGVNTYIAIVKATSHDLTSLQNLNTPLRGLSEMIDVAIVQIISLSEQTAQPATSHSMVDIVDVTVVSEYLEAQSQRLMSTAFAVSQKLYVRSLTPPASSLSE